MSRTSIVEPNSGGSISLISTWIIEILWNGSHLLVRAIGISLLICHLFTEPKASPASLKRVFSKAMHSVVVHPIRGSVHKSHERTWTVETALEIELP